MNKVPAVRNAELTRGRILAATFDLMYRNGYQGMRIDQILSVTELAKGALYHHFPNKQTLGYAVVDELLVKEMQERWIDPLRNAESPLQTIQQILNQACDNMTPAQMQLGCPLNNLSQEMGGLDDGFQKRLKSIYKQWSEAITDALTLGQQSGQVRQDINAKATAIFIISSLQGITGTAKCMQDIDMLKMLKNTLNDYIGSLAV
ncbi:MAG: TetR/AcrR family transcriptional repressor of nem operon [Phenylobacterium sp.]|jgi:TetR/AcrR family transcriptional repressor of nem operon